MDSGGLASTGQNLAVNKEMERGSKANQINELESEHVQKSSKIGKQRRTSSTITLYDLNTKKSKKTAGTLGSKVALRRWALVKENLFIIILEMQSKEKIKAKAIKEANQYATDAVGWDIAIKVESESDYASTKSDVTENSPKYIERSNQGRCAGDCNCCGLRRRKVTSQKIPISKNISIPNTHISCRLETFQSLLAIMQNDQITYEDCVREYYKPIIHDIGFIGSRKFHLWLWLAIITHVFLILAIIIDIFGYWVLQDPKYTTQRFTSSLLLLHIFCFLTRSSK